MFLSLIRICIVILSISLSEITLINLSINQSIISRNLTLKQQFAQPRPEKSPYNISQQSVEFGPQDLCKQSLLFASLT